MSTAVGDLDALVAERGRAAFVTVARASGGSAWQRPPRTDSLPLTGPPEIGEAASAFNLMRERLNRYVEDRTALIAAVAHDLRTPSTRLQLRLEDAPDDIRASNEADIQEMCARIGSARASSAT